MEFQWDPAKAVLNLRKHGVAFEEATTAFADPRSLAIADPLHSEGESRFVLLGRSQAGRMLAVVHTDRGDTIRLISARTATRKERKTYDEST
ncbi:MAG: hypothetical protein AD742_00160 [Methylibium sp. NZG]|nr:MAG: hypothetical protein AD742_00160 [Methylibium sp. NZG]